MKGLTLTRKAGESIEIGPDVTVWVSKIEGGRASLVIAAPQSTRIVRGEIPEERRHADRDPGPR